MRHGEWEVSYTRQAREIAATSRAWAGQGTRVWSGKVDHVSLLQAVKEIAEDVQSSCARNATWFDSTELSRRLDDFATEITYQLSRVEAERGAA